MTGFLAAAARHFGGLDLFSDDQHPRWDVGTRWSQWEVKSIGEKKKPEKNKKMKCFGEKKKNTAAPDFKVGLRLMGPQVVGGKRE